MVFSLSVVDSGELRPVRFLSNTCTLSTASAGRFWVKWLGVFTEEFPCRRRLPFHLFAHGADAAVAYDLSTPGSFSAVFHYGIGLGLVGVGVELYGVFAGW